MSVPFRSLGKNGPKVPAMGFGLLVMSGGYGKIPNDEERFQILDRAVELGNTFWDTANIYGDNEELLGKWFKRTGKRSEIFLATKFGITMWQGKHGSDSSAEYAKKSVEESLKKLDTDYIDLFYVHRLNYETPIEETMRALAELKAQGKIRNIGLSEVTSRTLRRAVKIAPVAAVQQEYSPFDRDIEKESSTNLLQTCRELGVSVVCYSPLGRGVLTENFAADNVLNPGDAMDMREKYFPRFQGENREANVKLVGQLKALADKKGISTSQLALAWLLKQGDDIIPIPGTKRIKYLEENWAALNVQLTDDEEAEIRAFVESAEVHGYRSLPSGQDLAFMDTKEET